MRRPLLTFTALLGTALAAPPLAAGPRVPAVASYSIDVSWSPEKSLLSGKETVTFVNRTARTFTSLRLHLFLNAFRSDGSTWLREARENDDEVLAAERGRGSHRFGWCSVRRLVLEDGTDLTGKLAFVSPDDGNPEDRTLAEVPLPRPVPPGGTLVFRVTFESRFPRCLARTGVKDDFLLAGQWFPKLSRATDAGWTGRQFHFATEFSADFGDYDVLLTVPRELEGKVAATGVEKTSSVAEDGRLRLHFAAEDVHDFAFALSPQFEVHRQKVARKGLPDVELVLFLQPDHRKVKERILGAARKTLELLGEWVVPYPYPALTIVDPPHGSNAEGMEYPTLFVAGTSWISPPATLEPEALVVHETAHQFFQGILASNETEEAPLDEGLATWATDRIVRAGWGVPPLTLRPFGVPFVFDSVARPLTVDPGAGYFAWQAASASDPLARPSWGCLDAPATLRNAYAKTALLLASFEATYGEKVWLAVLREYGRRFAFRHPTAGDLLRAVQDVAGDEAAGVLAHAWATTGTFDNAVTRVETRRLESRAGFSDTEVYDAGGKRVRDPKGAPLWESTVVVQRLGEAVWPVDVELRFEGGAVVKRTFSGRDRWVRYRATGARLVSAAVDPARKCLLDANRLNDARSVKPDPKGAFLWGHRLRFWAQNLLEAFALLAVVPGVTP